VVALVTKGDLGKLTPEQVTQVYIARCDALGLDVRATPFELINFKGKTQLYPKKEAAEQLRRINGISIEVKEETITPDGILRIRVKGTDAKGRIDEEVAALFVKNLQGEDLANAIMKAHTKAKRRLTLSMCGLGAAADIDEDDPRILRRQGLNLETGELVEITEPEQDYEAAERVEALRRYHAAGAEVGYDHDALRSFARGHYPGMESLSELNAEDLNVMADTIADAVRNNDAGRRDSVVADNNTGEITEPDEDALAKIYDAKSIPELLEIGKWIKKKTLGTQRVRDAYTTRTRELSLAKQPTLVGTPSPGEPGDDRHSR
jgi:hypothetical protein